MISSRRVETVGRPPRAHALSSRGCSEQAEVLPLLPVHPCQRPRVHANHVPGRVLEQHRNRHARSPRRGWRVSSKPLDQSEKTLPVRFRHRHPQSPAPPLFGQRRLDRPETPLLTLSPPSSQAISTHCESPRPISTCSRSQPRADHRHTRTHVSRARFEERGEARKRDGKKCACF